MDAWGSPQFHTGLLLDAAQGSQRKLLLRVRQSHATGDRVVLELGVTAPARNLPPSGCDQG